MRAVVLLSLVLVATPAAAQIAPAPGAGAQDFELWQRQEQLRQQLVAQHNELMALEAQLRAQQAITDLQAQRQTPRLTPPDLSRRPLPAIDTSRLASIPDAALAESNRRVLEAARNRR